MNQTVHTLSAISAMMFLQQNANEIDAETIKAAKEKNLQLVPMSFIWRVMNPKNNEIANASSVYKIGEVPLDKGQLDSKEYGVLQGLSFAHQIDDETIAPSGINFHSPTNDELIRSGEVSIIQKDRVILTISINEIIEGMKNTHTPGLYVLGGLEKLLAPNQTIIIRMSLPDTPAPGIGNANFYSIGFHGFKTKI